MAKRLTIFLGIIIILIVMCQVLLPNLVINGLSKFVKNQGNTERVTVSVEEFPAVLMLLGNFGKITVSANEVKTDKIALEKIDLRLDNVKLDIIGLLQDNRLKVESIEKAQLQAIVSEDTLAELINQRIKGAKDSKVKITPEKVTVASNLALGKMANAAVSLEGKIILSDNRIIFTTQQFNIDNPILGKLGGRVFTDLILVDFSNLPFDIRVKNIEQEDGRVAIQASNY